MRALPALLGIAFSAGCGVSSDGSRVHTLTFENEESSSLQGIYIDPVGDETFAPSSNVLDTELAPGVTLTIPLPCDHYDVEIFDALNRSCVVHDADLCIDGQSWVIDATICALVAD